MTNFITSTGVEDVVMAEASQSSEGVLESISELLRLRGICKEQNSICLVRKGVAEDGGLTKLNGDELVDEIEQEKSEITEKRIDRSLANDILEISLHSVEAECAANPKFFPPNDEDPALAKYQRSQARLKLLQLHEMTKEISDLKEQTFKLKQRNRELDEQINEVVARNRDTMQLLMHREKASRADQPKITEEEEEDLNKELKQIRCTKHVFQCLIQASRIDVYGDKELSKLVVELGKPEHI